MVQIEQHPSGHAFIDPKTVVGVRDTHDKGVYCYIDRRGELPMVAVKGSALETMDKLFGKQTD